MKTVAVLGKGAVAIQVAEWINAQPQDHTTASYYRAKQNDLLGDRRSFTRALSTGAVPGRGSAEARRGDAA